MNPARNGCSAAFLSAPRLKPAAAEFGPLAGAGRVPSPDEAPSARDAVPATRLLVQSGKIRSRRDSVPARNRATAPCARNEAGRPAHPRRSNVGAVQRRSVEGAAGIPAILTERGFAAPGSAVEGRFRHAQVTPTAASARGGRGFADTSRTHWRGRPAKSARVPADNRAALPARTRGAAEPRGPFAARDREFVTDEPRARASSAAFQGDRQADVPWRSIPLAWRSPGAGSPPGARLVPLPECPRPPRAAQIPNAVKRDFHPSR